MRRIAVAADLWSARVAFRLGLVLQDVGGALVRVGRRMVAGSFRLVSRRER